MVEACVLDILEQGELEITGRLAQASNATFLAEATLQDESIACVYKPIRGERPLWDFPTGSLAGREVAAYLVSETGGWGVVPPTVLGNGPYGVGMVQAWVEESDEGQVDLVAESQVPEGWLHVLDAFDARDNPVALIHTDRPELRAMALFDIVVNNADRKGGHVLTGIDGSILGCDHGICFHVENKLRTVLWGWAGEPLACADVELLEHARQALTTGTTVDRLQALVAPQEYACMLGRLDNLLDAAAFPDPGEHWPSIPWPAF